MTLDEVRDLLKRTSESEWHRIEAPTFYAVLEAFQVVDHQELSVNYHTDSAVYRDNVALTIGWGLQRQSGDTFTPDYLEKFPLEKPIRRTCVDVFWNGAVIDRVSLDILETSYLPSPMPHHDRRHKLERYTVEAYEVGMARLAHHLDKLYDDFDENLSRAGFEVVDTRA